MIATGAARCRVRSRSGRRRRLAAGTALATVVSLGAFVGPGFAAVGTHAQITLPFSGMMQPASVVFDASGDVFVSDPGTGRVLELRAGTSQPVQVPLAGLQDPFGLAVDHAGDLFVADYLTRQVVELRAGASGWSGQVTLPFTGLDRPSGVAVDRSGNVYVSDFGTNDVLELPAGATSPAQQVTLPFSGLSGPYLIAVDRRSNVYVSDFNNQRVVEVPAGATSPTQQVTLPFSGLSEPFGLSLDQAGDVFVADQGQGQVVALPAGATSASQEVTVPFTGLRFPGGVAVSVRGDVVALTVGSHPVLELPRIAVPPSIRARVKSSVGPSPAGWYGSPVTVSFVCRVHGGFPLARPCPPPVVLDHDGAGQSVTRTVAVTIGGSASATAGPVDIDQTPPRVRVSGVRDGHLYRAPAPSPRCVARDALSGLATCHLATHIRRIGAGQVVRFRAVARDQAGNRAVDAGRYDDLRFYLARTPFTSGAFDVVAGHHYTLVATATARRPVYYDSTVVPQEPYQRDHAFAPAGHHRWTVSVHLAPRMVHHEYWSMGVRIGRLLHLVRIRVS